MRKGAPAARRDQAKSTSPFGPTQANSGAKLCCMEWLNYHHLFYFWTVAREGTVSAASRKLRLAQPTISGQLKELESALGVALFHRRGGRLALTDTGSHVLRYATEIFSLGRELQESLAGGNQARGQRLVVGIADVVPKLIAHRLLEPALRSDPALRLECYEDRHERLLAELALYELDTVLSDTPVGPHSNFRAHSHLLGESAVSLFATAKLAERLRRRRREPQTASTSCPRSRRQDSTYRERSPFVRADHARARSHGHPGLTQRPSFSRTRWLKSACALRNSYQPRIRGSSSGSAAAWS